MKKKKNCFKPGQWRFLTTQHINEKLFLQLFFLSVGTQITDLKYNLKTQKTLQTAKDLLC